MWQITCLRKRQVISRKAGVRVLDGVRKLEESFYVALSVSLREFFVLGQWAMAMVAGGEEGCQA